MSADPGALVRVPTGSVTERSRALWSDEQVNLIGATVAEGATKAQLFMFLELAAKYDLDPFAKEIWCAVPKNENGTPRTDKVMIMVGRDGFLKIAQRHPDFLGMDGDVVRSEDDFEVELRDGERTIRHKYGPKRGAIVGAWCMVRRKGRTPTYFYAALDEFKPNGASARSQWVKGPGTMILKCAEAGALRRAFSISGIVAEEEVTPMGVEHQIEPPPPTASAALVDRVRSLFDQARMLDQDAYTPAKQRLLLAGADEERLIVVEREAREFIESHGGVVTETAESEEVDDAEVVAEAGASEAPDAEPEATAEAKPEIEPEPEVDPVQEAARRAMAAHGIATNVDEPADGTTESAESLASEGADQDVRAEVVEKAAEQFPGATVGDDEGGASGALFDPEREPEA